MEIGCHNSIYTAVKCTFLKWPMKTTDDVWLVYYAYLIAEPVAFSVWNIVV